jgi:hypothetical protein
MEPFGLPNKVIAEISAKILESPRLLNYIYYTGIEHKSIDLFSLESPSAKDLVDKHIFIGRRIPNLMKKVGAFLDIRVNRYEPMLNKRSTKLIKYVEVDIDVLCHVDCQRTLRGTRDITIIALLQEALENESLTGLSESIEIVTVTEILGLDTDYNGYTLKIRVTGFNQGLYNE